MWIMSCRGITAGIHYLDDFLFFGRPQASECDENLAKALSICNELGVPVATNKLEGPTTCLTLLGLQLDSQDGIISLPAVKLQKVKSTIAEWLTRRACTKRQLLSVIGTLHHATSVVKAGRAFLRRLIDLAGTVKQLHYWVRINSEARADLRWWDAFLESWNGKSIINTLVSRPPAIQLTSDASGSWGCEAIWRCNWFQWKWSREWEEISIAPKELLPILLASATWGKVWRGEIVLFRCDNQTVVSALAKSSSRDKIVMQLLRVLHFVAAFYSFTWVSMHITGVSNVAADALSRDSMPKNQCLSLQLNEQPAAIPLQFLELLLSPHLDWSSHTWRRRLAVFLRQA